MGFVKEKYKETILAILISALSFALGYVFAQENNRAPIIIEKHSQ